MTLQTHYNDTILYTTIDSSGNNSGNPKWYSSTRVIRCVSVHHLDAVDDGTHTDTQCAAGTILSDVG